MKLIFLAFFAVLSTFGLNNLNAQEADFHTYTKSFTAFNTIVSLSETKDSSIRMIVITHNRINDTIKYVPENMSSKNIIKVIKFDFITDEIFATMTFDKKYQALNYAWYKKDRTNHFRYVDYVMLYLNDFQDPRLPINTTYKHRIIDMKNIIIYGNEKPETHWFFDTQLCKLVKKE